jgi:hypothetical protein
MSKNTYKPEFKLRNRQQIATELNTTVQVVDRLRKSGAIPYIACGHFVRFDLDQVKAALSRHTINAA